MTCFVFEVKKMRAEISVPDHYCIASETVWSSSYDLLCGWDKKRCAPKFPAQGMTCFVFCHSSQRNYDRGFCVINYKGTNQMMAIKSCWSWESNDPYDHEVVVVRLISFCSHFGVRLGGLLLNLAALGEQLGTILHSCWGTWASWRPRCRSEVDLWDFDSPHFGGVWEPIASLFEGRKAIW